jgi:hypothetical protein
MCLLLSMNWVFISQMTKTFIVTAVNTSNCTKMKVVNKRATLQRHPSRCSPYVPNLEGNTKTQDVSKPTLHDRK